VAHAGRGSARVAVDIGGTFTDLVCLAPDGRVHTRKVPSTTRNYADAMLGGLGDLLRDAGCPGDEIGDVVHGTTVASNAILELKGARTGLITTAGFRDTLEIRRLRMPRLYDLGWQKPPPLVERRLRLEVRERITGRGDVAAPLDRDDAARAVRRLVADGVEALAVCLINSYANPAHERAVRAVVERVAPHLTLCLSSDVLPEVKEYERTSTTVINAYLLPVVTRYLESLIEGLTAIGVRSPLRIMQSNGGTMDARRAARLPIHIVESGPAAGVIGAQALARRMALPDVITLDMGGTTAKAAIVERGELQRAAEYEVGGGIMQGSRLPRGGGYLLRVPSLDLAEVGAGGGSLIRVDSGGSMRVGPESAGAVPGPVCYDLGGSEPTVTDANVLLGYLNPDALVDGAVPLNAARAREALERCVARPLSLDATAAAYGAYQLASASMIRAIKAVSSERGRDPRGFALCAFGGNGPVFAVAIARALGIARVVVPPHPGLFSAFGLLYADVECHLARTYRRQVDRVDPLELREAWRSLEETAVRELAADGWAPRDIGTARSADLRYRGQSFELTVPVPSGETGGAAIGSVVDAFHAQHERTYGHRGDAGDPVEIVTLRVHARVRTDRPGAPGRAPSATADDGPARTRRAYFGRDAGWCLTPVVRRGALTERRPGPLVVEEYDATCVVPPGASAALDQFGNIAIDTGEGGARVG